MSAARRVALPAVVRPAVVRPAVVVAAVVALVTAVLALGAGAAGALPSAPVAKAPPTTVLTLLGQSTWVGDNKVFSLRLGVAADVPSTDTIVVTAYPRLNNRTDFDEAANGRLGAEPGAAWTGEESVGAAPRAAAGGVWARIPVDTQVRNGDLQTEQAFNPGNQSGVYPLQVQLIGADETAVGSAISTFLVYSAGQAAFPRLLTSVTVPVSAHLAVSAKLAPAPLPASSSATLDRLSATLAAHSQVPLSLAVSPATAASLATGSAIDGATLGRLAGLVGGGDELLPALYAPVAASSLVYSGLASEVPSQLEAGRDTLARTLGTEPEAATWVLNGPADDATLQLLRRNGLRQLVMPETALSALPARLVTTTYARPTGLDDGAGGDGLRVFGADATIAARVTQSGSPVLAAEQTLAELAMIELETPSLLRGVALSLPASALLSPAYLETLLDGLQANPFLEPVTATQLLDRVPARPPAASPGAASAAVPVRTLRAAAFPQVPSAQALLSLARDVQGLRGLLPADTALIDSLALQLLVAPAPSLTDSQRNAILGSMSAALSKAESSVRLPGDTSVTLTSLKATLPLIVLSDARVSPHVRLVLSSPKLDFRAFRPPHGSCQVEERTTEVCTMVLSGPETVLRVPVESRTSGVFALDVWVTSPDGSLVLATARDTIRSTAVSSVGIVIIVVSILFLGIWWIRNIHSGRRARQLVRRPGDDIDDGGDGEGPPGGGAGPVPPPASDPVGTSDPAEPRQALPLLVTVSDPGLPAAAGRRHRQPHPPAHREPHDPRPVEHTPLER
jgi:hypothetical protein